MRANSSADGRVIVAGAGIGGLSAAIALRRAGLDVIVLERAPALTEVGAGITLWSNALRVLRAIGADEAVVVRGAELVYGELRTPAGGVLARTPLAPLSRELGAPCVALRRADLIEALQSCLPPGIVRTSAEVAGAESERDRVRVMLADGQELSGCALVGADGIGSTVRALLHGDVRARYSGYTCWRAITSHAGLPPGHAFESWGPGRRFGAVSVRDDHAYWFAAENAPPGGRDVDARAHLLELFGGWHAPIEALVEGTPEAVILRNDIFDLDPLPGGTWWGRGRITLLGDSAHASTPNLGQGACMAIEDAFVLARALATADDVSSALRGYERSRSARTRTVTMRSRRLGRVGQIGSPLLCSLRNAVMRVLPAGLTRRAYETIARNGPA